MQQKIGAYAFDAVTQAEMENVLKAELGHHFSQVMRDWFRGVKPVKLPVSMAVAGGTTTPLTGAGPAQGFVWKLLRVTVSSSGADTGAVALYAGSDPSEVTPQFLIDGTLAVGKAYYPGGDGLLLMPGEQLYASVTSVAGNAYRLSGQAVEVPAEMVGKLFM